MISYDLRKMAYTTKNHAPHNLQKHTKLVKNVINLKYMKLYLQY